MNSRDVFPLFVDAYDFVKSILGSKSVAEYYQSVKRTEEESGLSFSLGSKRGYAGCLYIWRMRRSRIYHIGWWIDSEHEDLCFSSRRQFP
ncbi:MAG: hypothetical protein ACE5KU_03825, partial [Nitrososphaerales archaeon]